jgi:hypothetical protein
LDLIKSLLVVTENGADYHADRATDEYDGCGLENFLVPASEHLFALARTAFLRLTCDRNSCAGA